MDKTRIDILKKQKSINRPLILDGAVGSLLQQRNIPLDKNLWSSIANVTHPKDVIDLHTDYINAGADIITTNTFRTNPSALKKSNLNISIEKFVSLSVSHAVNARREKEIIIAGSNAPAEDCYQFERTIPKYELDYNHKKHIELLLQYGCDIIWNETQSHWDEIEIICKFCSSNSLPYIINLFFSDELKLLSGEQLQIAISWINDYSPLAIGFNCVKYNLLTHYLEKYSLPNVWGFYFNCGAGKITDEIILCAVKPHDYFHEIEPFLDLNPLYVGSCCGSGPDHTRVIKEKFDEKYRN